MAEYTTDNTAYRLTGTAVSKLADMWRASQRDNPGPATPDGLRARYGERWFYGKITGGGPGVYTFTRQFLANSGGQDSDKVTFVDAEGDYALTASATNLADLFASQPALDPGDYVIVRWDYDATSPTPKVRYLINQISQQIVAFKLVGTHGSGGMYDGVILYGNASDPGSGKVIMPEGMDESGSNAVSCLVFHLNENNLSGWRASTSTTTTQTNAYGVGFIAGWTTEQPARPIVLACGLMGDDSNPKSLPNATVHEGSDSTTWQYNTDAQGALATLMTSFGVFKSSPSASPPELWWNTRDVRFDAMGGLRFIHAEQEQIFTLAWVAVPTAFHDTGSAITYDTTNLLVFATAAGSTGETLFEYGGCS